MTIKNLAASVHARLMERARKDGRPFQELLEYFAMERFLYRLSSSPHGERFVLKGALMLRVWDAPAARPTRDIDLLGRMDNSPENLARVVAEVCDAEVEPDGLVFKVSTVKAMRIKEDADYGESAFDSKACSRERASRCRSTSASATSWCRRRRRSGIRPCSSFRLRR